MAIQMDAMQIEILIRSYLDSRQMVETLEELNNVDEDLYPAGILTYCKENHTLYKRNPDNTWLKVDMGDVESYLFLSKEDDERVYDYDRPIYASLKEISNEEVIHKYILNTDKNKENEINYITNSTDFQNDSNKIYSQQSIELQLETLNTNSLKYLNKQILNAIKPNFEEVSSVSEMVDSGTFYLIESTFTPGTYIMYIIEESGQAVPLGSSQLSIGNYQKEEDNTLETNNKKVVQAINELVDDTRINKENIGELKDIKIPEHSSNLVDAINYSHMINRTIGDTDELKTKNKESIVAAVNEIDKIHGLTKSLNTPKKDNFVSSINSFYGKSVPPGAILPYFGHEDKPIPEGFLECNGQEVAIAKYENLFKIIGYTFGAGENLEEQCFKLPDMTSATAVGYDSEDEDFNFIGKKGGEELHVLTTEEIPKHNHTILETEHTHTVYTEKKDFTTTVATGSSARDEKNDGYSSGTNISRGSSTSWVHDHYYTSFSYKHYHNMNTTGDNVGHTNLQPCVTCRFIIKY